MNDVAECAKGGCPVSESKRLLTRHIGARRERQVRGSLGRVGLQRQRAPHRLPRTQHAEIVAVVWLQRPVRRSPGSSSNGRIYEGQRRVVVGIVEVVQYPVCRSGRVVLWVVLGRPAVVL